MLIVFGVNFTARALQVLKQQIVAVVSSEYNMWILAVFLPGLPFFFPVILLIGVK
jgi:hypothetical protein